jgi:hypothetical protein
MRGAVLAFAMVACRSAPAPTRAEPEAPAAAPPMQFFPLAEVLRDGIWTERGPHAVIGSPGGAVTLLAVVDERGDEVRVVFEDHYTRLAGWMPRNRLHPTVVEPVALAGAIDGNPREEHAAVLLLPGVLITPLERREGRARIEATDDEVTATGWIDEDVLGQIWVAEPFPDDPPATHTLAEGAEIRVAPSSDATVVATMRQYVFVAVLGATDSWTEVRVTGSWMNVHGWVESYRVGDGGLMGAGGFAPFRGDMHEWPDVPDGACLVEEPGGEPVGVLLTPRENQEPTDGGAKIVVEAPWGQVTVRAEEAAGGWRTCPLAISP